MERFRIVIRYVAGLFGLSILIADLYALLFSRFVPSTEWVRISIVAAAICGMGGVALAFMPASPKGRTARWLTHIWLRVPAFALFSSFAGYEAFAAGFPAWFTYFAGAETEQSATIADWRSGGRVCFGPDLVEAPLIWTVCVPPRYIQKFHPGDRIVLKGKGTRTGTIASSVFMFSSDEDWRKDLAIRP